MTVAPSAVIKETARVAMRGRFLKCVVGACALLFTWLILLYSASLFGYATSSDIAVLLPLAIGGVFLAAPLLFGVMRFYWRILWNCSDNVVTVFYYFSSKALYGRVLRLVLHLFVRLLVIGFLLQIPALIADLFSSAQIYHFLGADMPAFASSLWVIAVFLRTAAYIALFIIMLRYYLAPFLLIACEDISPEEALRLSQIMARGTAVDFVVLLFSFLPLILISFLMVPAVFTLPYFLVSYLVHARFAATRYNRMIDRMNAAPASTVPPSFDGV